MKMKYILLAAIALGSQTAAQGTTYADRASFLAALGGTPTTIDFTGIIGSPGFPDQGGFYQNTSAAGYTLQGVSFIGATSAGVWNPDNIFYSLGGSVSGMFGQGGGTFKVNVPINSLGFDFGSSFTSGIVPIILNFSDATKESATLTNKAGVSFFGYTGLKTITSVNVNASGTNEFFKYDNVTLGNLAVVTPPTPPAPGAVPEPATWAMMIAGFGLVGAAARRRRVVARIMCAA